MKFVKEMKEKRFVDLTKSVKLDCYLEHTHFISLVCVRV